jgi:hypothetical protein
MPRMHLLAHVGTCKGGFGVAPPNRCPLLALLIPPRRQIYESMLFLFVEHAFDVGDLLEVETVQYRVKKIDLQFIVSRGQGFRRQD